MRMVLFQIHIELHDVAVVGFCADGDESSLAMALFNVWMLLNYFRALNSAWPMQLMGMELLISLKLMRDETFDFAVGISSMKCAAHLTGNKNFDLEAG